MRVCNCVLLSSCLLLALACGDDGSGPSADAGSSGAAGSTSSPTTGDSDPDPTDGGNPATTDPDPSTTSGSADSTGTPADSSSGGDDPLSYAGDMNGYRWELPCEDPQLTDTCPWDPALLEGALDDPNYTLHREDLVVFGGDPTVVYDVEIRIRGLTEPKDFSGGTVVADHFQIGGDPGSNDYNIYAIDVADPPERYTLNRNEMGTGHYTFVMDYTVTIPVRGGSEVRMTMIDPNNIAIANPGGASGQAMPFIVPEIPPFPDPFFGQFIQMDVLSVTESAG